MKTFDILVVGAGPAGATSAFILANNGFKVALIEKAKTPRFKPCGGGLTPKTVNLLKKLDLYEDSVISNTCEGLTIYYRNNFSFEIKNARIYLTSREKFDHNLVNQAKNAGAHFFQKTKIVKIEEQDQKIKATSNTGETFQGDLLIGADGANSTVGKYLHRKWRPQDLSIGAVTVTNTKQKTPKHCETMFGLLPDGYAWIFPLGRKTANIGVGASLKYANKILSTLQSFLQSLNAEKRYKIHAHILPTPRKIKKNTIGRKNIFLIGDAAGLVDPWLGEGIYYAIKSAQLLANSIIRNKNILDDYYSHIQKEIITNFKYAQLYRKIFYKKLEKSLKIIKKHRITQEAFTLLLEGEIQYKNLLQYLTTH